MGGKDRNAKCEVRYIKDLWGLDKSGKLKEDRWWVKNSVYSSQAFPKG